MLSFGSYASHEGVQLPGTMDIEFPNEGGIDFCVGAFRLTRSGVSKLRMSPRPMEITSRLPDEGGTSHRIRDVKATYPLNGTNFPYRMYGKVFISKSSCTSDKLRMRLK